MSILFRSRPETRSVLSLPWSSGDEGVLSRDVDPLTLIPVYAATALIADMFASTPWAAYREVAGVPQKSTRQPKLLTQPGVNRIDLFSWKHQCAVSQLLRGNAYGLVTAVDGRGVPSSVAWLPPQHVNVDESGATPVFTYKGQLIERDSLIHIPLYTVPGKVKGLSPVGLFRRQLELGAEAQRVGRNFFRRGAFPPAILRNTEKTLDPEQTAVAKRRFVASVSSSEPLVTGADWEFTAITLPAGEASFLAAIKATATQVAAIYRVPPEDIGGETSGTALTYKNLEMDMARFNVRTMRPITTRAEAVFSPYLQPSAEYVRFNLDAGVRADLKSRYEAHKIALEAEFLTIDEVRALEERGPIPNLEGHNDE